MKMFRKDEGFTLVELMVVVLIIGILVAIAIPVFLNASKNAEQKSCQANQRTISGAISTYGATEGSPLEVTAATKVSSVSGMVPTYIKSAPKCPTSKKEYMLKSQGTAPSIVTTVCSDSEADGTWVTDHQL